MARKKKRRRRNGFSIRTVEKFMGMGAFLGPGLVRGKAVLDAEKNPMRAITEGVTMYAGVRDGKFNTAVLAEAWLPYLAFSVVSKGVHKLNGIIRRL